MGGSRGRFVGHSWGGGRHASRVATEIMGRYVYLLVEGGWSGGWSDGRRSGGMSPLIG